ncbi:MAG: LuxR C-terminal-related transcriptional regulator [Vulcanimicrobiaceae bacterium]
MATLESMLRSADVAGTHRRNRRWGAIDLAGSPTLRALATRSMIADTWQFVHDGDPRSAFALTRLARDLAPTPFLAVHAVIARAAVAFAFDNDDAARDHVAEALDHALALDWNEAADDERLALVVLTELLVRTESDAAAEVFANYGALAARSERADAYEETLITYVAGLVQRAMGDLAGARTTLTAVYRRFVELGALWRATLALLELDACVLPGEASGDWHLELAATIVREHHPHSFLLRRLGRAQRAYDDATIARLTLSKRAVLADLLAGRSPREIATQRGLSEGTVRNYIADIESTFAVHSIQELLVACYRRGLDTVSWEEPAEAGLSQGVTPGAGAPVTALRAHPGSALR